MDVRIGISESNQVVEVDMTDDTDRRSLKDSVADAIGTGSMLWVADKKGKETGVPGAKIAFVEIGTSDADRRIGFGA
jgi:hypothetical protein